jgi:hypothetical protein
MLLSNEIEKALYAGECVYKTFNTGYTNTFTIPIPAGSYIILRQIIYYPVVSSSADFLTRSVVQLSINEQGSNNEMLYSFRNNINVINSSINPAAPNLIFTGGNPQNVETWKVFKKNITIDLCFGDSSTNLVYAANNIFEQNADERTTPLGYNLLSIQNQVAIQPGLNRIYPTGQQRQFIPPNEFNGPVRDRLRYDNNLNNLIPNADILQNSVAYQFPLFTFGYFEFQTAKSINLQ